MTRRHQLSASVIALLAGCDRGYGHGRRGSVSAFCATMIPVPTGVRVWIASGHLRNDRPFGGEDPPAAVFHYSRYRRGEHPQAHLANYACSSSKMYLALEMGDG
jgi:hypothetical protein